MDILHCSGRRQMVSSHLPQHMQSDEIASPAEQNLLPTQRALCDISQVRDASSLVRHLNPVTQVMGSKTPTSFVRYCLSMTEYQRSHLLSIRRTWKCFDIHNRRSICFRVKSRPPPCIRALSSWMRSSYACLPPRICHHHLIVYISSLGKQCKRVDGCQCLVYQDCLKSDGGIRSYDMSEEPWYPTKERTRFVLN